MRWTLTIVGIVVVVFALVWLLAIFPAMAKLPEDHDREVNFEGIYKVMNPDTMAMDEIPVNVQRLQKATDVQDNVLIIDQKITCTHAIADMVLPDFGLEEVLGVDRSTREYVPGYGDMNRSGQFCFPSDVQQESYSTWIPSAGRPLEAKFMGEEELDGLKVFAFEISEENLDIGTQEGTGYPQVMDIVTTMKVEPVSGTTVDTTSNTTYKVEPMQGMKVAYYISSISFTDETVADLLDTAKSARSMILWATVYGFWIVIGVGVVLIAIGVVMFARAKA